MYLRMTCILKTSVKITPFCGKIAQHGFESPQGTVYPCQPCSLGQVTQPHLSQFPSLYNGLKIVTAYWISLEMPEASEHNGLSTLPGMKLGCHVGNISCLYIQTMGHFATSK